MAGKVAMSPLKFIYIKYLKFQRELHVRGIAKVTNSFRGGWESAKKNKIVKQVWFLEHY